MENTIWGELVKFGAQGILVGIGWFVVNKLSISRERDKARKEMVAKSTDNLCESIDKLFEISRDYHLAIERDLKAEIKIKMMLQDFSFRVTSLKDLTGNTPAYLECFSEIIVLRQSITSNHFEDEHIGAIESSSPIHEIITSSTLKLKRNLIAVKHSQFSVT